MQRRLAVIVLLVACVCLGTVMAQSTIEKAGKKVETGAKQTGGATVKGAKKVGEGAAEGTEKVGKGVAKGVKKIGEKL